MTSDSRNLDSPLAWLVDWMEDAGRHDQCHSLVLNATGACNLHHVSSAVADYLNEFDHDCGCAWRTFDSDLLEILARNPTTRNLVLENAPEHPDDEPSRPDLHRVVRSLLGLGGVIIVGRCGIDAAADLRETFHVNLCNDGPPAHQDCHMWVNPGRFSPASLVSVIADSFLGWSCQHEALRGSSPDFRSCELGPNDEPTSVR